MTMKIVIILNNHELYGKHNTTFWPRQKALQVLQTHIKMTYLFKQP